MKNSKGSYASKLGGKIFYTAFVPENYDATKKYPVIINFTGDTEKGFDGVKLANNVLVKDMAGGLELPFIVFTPQCPFANYDTDNSSKLVPGQFAAEALDIAISKFSIDETKAYVMGLSMGGVSVDFALATFPDRFAAGVNIASWPPPGEYAAKIKGGIWHIKNNHDPRASVPQPNIDFLNSATNAKEAKYSILNLSDHDAWSPTFLSFTGDFSGTKLDPAYPKSAPLGSPFDWLLKFSTAAPVVVPPVVTPPVGTPPTVTITIPETMILPIAGKNYQVTIKEV